MGSFSWNKADGLTRIENVAYGADFKFLIPIQFGGGFIKDTYQDYGYLGSKEDGEPKYDMYELLAFWNKADGLTYDGKFPLMKEIDKHTDKNRREGINIGCYDVDIDKLQFPLKLVSRSFVGSYEDLSSPSLGDPDQGFFERKRKLTK
jgi:methionine synthase II (cobalamin-independent)|tara:strand:- start:13499 stop:13942 length:444 start_codon:yes stop_codon:yes gene_type:complete